MQRSERLETRGPTGNQADARHRTGECQQTRETASEAIAALIMQTQRALTMAIGESTRGHFNEVAADTQRNEGAACGEGDALVYRPAYELHRASWIDNGRLCNLFSNAPCPPAPAPYDWQSAYARHCAQELLA